MDVEVFIVILRPSLLRAPSSSSSSSSIHANYASGRHVSNLYTVGPSYLFIYFFLHAISPRVGYLKKVGWKIIEDRVTVASWKEICNLGRIMIKAFRQFGRLKAVDGEYQGMKCLKVFTRESSSISWNIVRHFDYSSVYNPCISAAQFHIRLIVTFCTWIVSIWSERI